ncbi:MAG: hypothetical protein ABFS34_04780 [Gemmatimonadota bacterium]
MYGSLQRLLAQQTTPLELIYFIITVCALAIVGAALIYALVMSVLWVVRLRATVRYHRVFLPTRAHLMAFLPEYLLAFVTTAVLTLTIAVKGDIVDQVLAYDVSDIPEGEVGRMLPLGAAPVAGELGGFADRAARINGLLRGEAQTSTRVSAAAVLKPFLEAGRAGEVRRVLGVIVDDVTRSTRVERALLRGLLIASLVMILAYLGWLARGRFKSLRASPDAPVIYEETLRRVAMMGIALALILASSGMVDEELVADSALGALRHEAPAEPDTVLAEAIRVAVDYQHALHRPLRAFDGIGDVDSVGVLLAGLGTRLRTTESGLSAAQSRLVITADSLGFVGTKLSAHEDLVADHLNEFEGLLNELASQSERVAGLEREVEALRRESARQAQLVEDRFGPVLEELRSSVAVNERGIARLNDLNERLNGALREVLARQDGRELLLVSTNGDYTISGGGAQPAAGARMGLHWLPTGVRHVVRASAGSRPVTLRPGEPQAVMIFRADVVQP